MQPESSPTGQMIEMEFVEGAEVFIRANGRWSPAFVVNFRGDNVQLRFTPWNADEAKVEWFEMSEVSLKAPWATTAMYVKPHGIECPSERSWDCDGCDDCTLLIEKPHCYVTVYEVTRHYGGPEEGGWWANLYIPVCSIPVMRPGDPDEIEEIKAFLKPRWTDEGNIYSVRGGSSYDLVAEVEAGSNAVTSVGRYE